MHRPKDDENTKTKFFLPLFQIFDANHPQSMMIGVKTFMTFVNNANVKEIHHEILSFCRFDLVIRSRFSSILSPSWTVICGSKCYTEIRIKKIK